MRRTVLLYSPSVVLLAWAVAWAAGATADGVMIAALLAEAGAIWLHVREQLRRYGVTLDPPRKPVRRRADDRRRSYRDFWLVAISVFLVWSAFQGQQTADDAQDAATAARDTARQNRVAILQGCALTKARLQDNVSRLQQAVDYLHDPQAVRENPGLIRTIRDISIPFNVRQIKVDRKNFPSTCGRPPPLPRDLRPLFKR